MASLQMKMFWGTPPDVQRNVNAWLEENHGKTVVQCIRQSSHLDVGRSHCVVVSIYYFESLTSKMERITKARCVGDSDLDS